MIPTPASFLVALLISSISFLFYGWSSLASARMKVEFQRYRLEHYRRLVGGVQLMGSAGLICGLWLPALGASAAVGLVMLMVLGIAVRLGLRDTVFQMLPAALYLILNVYLAVYFFIV